MLEQSDISDETTSHHLSNQQLNHFISNLKGFRFNVNGTLPIDKAFVTGGGVSLKEIQPKTMMSKSFQDYFVWRGIRYTWLYWRIQYNKCISDRSRCWI